MSSNDSDVTIRANDVTEDGSNTTIPNNFKNFQIPVVGYEIMEERAKFTVMPNVNVSRT